MDPDCGVNAMVNYTLGGGLPKPQFSVKPDTGELCVSAPLDHEMTSDFEFPVIATDRGNYCLTNLITPTHFAGGEIIMTIKKYTSPI